MKVITAKEFYSAWIKSTKSQEKTMLKKWRNNSEFTKLIKGTDNSIVSNVAKEINLDVYEQDYYSIDSVFYVQEDLLEKPFRGKYWFKRLRIAFEHENTFNRGIFEEIVHLLILKCDLRVLVIYPDDTPWDQLKEIKEIIQSVDQNHEILNNQAFLVICGYYNNFEWQGFAYNGKDEWEQL